MPGDWWEAKPASEADSRRSKKPRPWRDKFREAFRGIKLGVRGHSSFFVHFFFAALALAAALALRCDLIEWCLVIGCIGMVITAELFNSAIETLFHGLDDDSKTRIQGCLDIAAGAVLAAGMTSAIVGSIIFGQRLLLILHVGEG
ncbi:MAG: diacylglycerol kinase [Planctomycetes bacterium]|nr:diacylglycerol kinase [Planctomycetota bacterium]